MKRTFYTALLTIFLFGAFLGGMLYNQRDTGKNRTANGDRRVLYYVDPMNPSHISEKPGTAPCGMPMEPVYADEDSGDRASRAASAPKSEGTVKINAQKQQIIGVKVGEVEMGPESARVRTLGRVAPIENQVHRILSGADGWVWDVKESTTGSLVQKDQLLASLYIYQFLTKEQQYIYALDIAERRKATAQRQAQAAARKTVAQASLESGDTDPDAQKPDTQESYKQDLGHMEVGMPDMVPTQSLGINNAGEGGVYFINDPVELAKLELYNLGAGDHQLKEIARTKKITKELEIRSPATGIILARNVSPRQRFEKGGELFRVADISRVWVLADVFEREARYIQPGTLATISLPRQDKVFEARVSEILPQFDPATRSYKVRLELDNPDFALLPDAFVDVEFMISFPPSIAVPMDALINSGTRKIVYVDLGNGYFEPRDVKTGWHSGDRVEIVEGLMPGESIVLSGNFLLDSESRMKLAAVRSKTTVAAQDTKASVKDPVCGMKMDPAKARAAGLVSESGGKSYYFCSEPCKTQFEKGIANKPSGNGGRESSKHNDHARHDSAKATLAHDKHDL